MGATERLEGKPVAERILRTARAAVDVGTAAHRRPPCLLSLHLARSSPFAFYLRRQAASAAVAGVEFREESLPPETTAERLHARLAELNEDRSVDAVLLEHPLPPELKFAEAVDALRPSKDVDGVNAANLGHLVQGRPVQAPAVALGALAILRHYEIPVAGRRVAVVGRSSTVGLPLSLLLLARGEGGDATVTVAHSKTPDLRSALAGASVILSCVGVPGLLTREVVPNGAVVVDVGLSTVPDATKPGKERAVGDADGPSLDGWASAVTPVPGGVGPVTVAQLMGNAVRAWTLLDSGKER